MKYIDIYEKVTAMTSCRIGVPDEVTPNQIRELIDSGLEPYEICDFFGTDYEWEVMYDTIEDPPGGSNFEIEIDDEYIHN